MFQQKRKIFQEKHTENKKAVGYYISKNKFLACFTWISQWIFVGAISELKKIVTSNIFGDFWLWKMAKILYYCQEWVKMALGAI